MMKKLIVALLLISICIHVSAGVHKKDKHGQQQDDDKQDKHGNKKHEEQQTKRSHKKPVHHSDSFSASGKVLTDSQLDAMVSAETNKEIRADYMSKTALKMNPATLPYQVILVRHGEKGEEKVNLNVTGHQRSLCLADFFMNPIADFPVPEVIYAMKQHGTTGSNRPFLTLLPFSKARKVPINNKFAVAQEAEVVRDILTHNKGKTVLLSWEHNHLMGIAKFLGACSKSGRLSWGLDPDAKKEDGHNFSAVWALKFSYNKEHNEIGIIFDIYREVEITAGNAPKCFSVGPFNKRYYTIDCNIKL
jgi:uncharacterized protein YxeA